MNLPRRQFLKTTALLGAAAALDLPKLTAAAVPTTPPSILPRDYFELRAYRLANSAAASVLDAYLQGALIPALNARGVRHVGVFTEPEAIDGAAIWVLIAHPSLASVGEIAATEADAAGHPEAGAYISGATKERPAFTRIDSWLLAGFDGMPRLAVPALTEKAESRVFELRTYESFSEAKARNKVDMFNAGEIGVMQELGMAPVFYGQGLIGRDLPHLTYMLCSRDRETAARHWKAFSQHPVWNRLKSDPQYADNVSKITSRFLVPTTYSQL